MDKETELKNGKNSNNFTSKKITYYDFDKYKSSKKYINNQANCILSLSRNIQINHRNISELFHTYNELLKENISNDFEDSLKQSKDGFEIQCQGNNETYLEKIKNLKINTPQSFLIIPMLSQNHCFCAVVRKTLEGFSATLVNASKGGRRGDDRGNHVGYEEYIFSPQNLKSFLNILAVTSLCNVVKDKSAAKTNAEIYELFEKESVKKFCLNLESRDQKDGNCFVKEPEKAIKYAFATRNFTVLQLEDLRNLNLDKIFKPKWHTNTREIHRLYIEQLKKENPEKSEILDKKYQLYLRYKDFGGNEQKQHMWLSGRSMEYADRIEFQDENSKLIGKATPYKDGFWCYRDQGGNVIGYSKEEQGKKEYFDIGFKSIGYGKKEDIGEKYFKPNGALIGFARYYKGMVDLGYVAIEHKGKSMIDIMVELSKHNNRTPLQEKILHRRSDENAVKKSFNGIKHKKCDRGISI